MHDRANVDCANTLSPSATLLTQPKEGTHALLAKYLINRYILLQLNLEQWDEKMNYMSVQKSI